jgi:hypothetical protein
MTAARTCDGVCTLYYKCTLFFQAFKWAEPSIRTTDRHSSLMLPLISAIHHYHSILDSRLPVVEGLVLDGIIFIAGNVCQLDAELSGLAL